MKKCKNCLEPLPFHCELIGKKYCCSTCEYQFNIKNPSQGDDAVDTLKSIFGMR